MEESEKYISFRLNTLQAIIDLELETRIHIGFKKLFIGNGVLYRKPEIDEVRCDLGGYTIAFDSCDATVALTSNMPEVYISL